MDEDALEPVPKEDDKFVYLTQTEKHPIVIEHVTERMDFAGKVKKYVQFRMTLEGRRTKSVERGWGLDSDDLNHSCLERSGPAQIFTDLTRDGAAAAAAPAAAAAAPVKPGRPAPPDWATGELEAEGRDGVWSKAVVVEKALPKKGKKGTHLTVQYSQRKAPRGGRLYRAENNDTFRKIAERLGTDHDVLLKLNPKLADDAQQSQVKGRQIKDMKLEADTKLFLPELVVCSENTTCAKLAQKYRRDAGEMVEINKDLGWAKVQIPRPRHLSAHTTRT